MSIGLPEVTIKFTGLGASAVQRGSKGVAVLLLKEKEDVTTIKEYKTILDFTEEERKNYSKENIVNILDVLEEAPKSLIVSTFAESEDNSGLNKALKLIDGKAEMNCWIGLADAKPKETVELISFVKASNQEKKKKI